MVKEYSAEPCPRCLKERADGTLSENYRCEACRILFFEWKLTEKDKTIKHLDIELKKKERKIKSFCKNDCDGGKEMGLCECCSLGTLLDSPRPPNDYQPPKIEVFTMKQIEEAVKPKPSNDTNTEEKAIPVLIGTVGKDNIPVNCSTCGWPLERMNENYTQDKCYVCKNYKNWKPKPSKKSDDNKCPTCNGKEEIWHQDTNGGFWDKCPDCTGKKPSDPIDPKYPKCAGCRRASHNAHCGLAITGKCKDGSLFELSIKCPKCDSKLIGKYDEDGGLIGRFCENCSYTEGDA